MVAINLKRIGRKNSVVFGYIVMTFATAGFSTLYYINDTTTFFAVGLVTRGL